MSTLTATLPAFACVAAGLVCFALCRALPAQVQWFDRAELMAQQAERGKPWLPFLDTGTLSCGIYRLAKGARDGQGPHAQDEVYHVLAGKAVLEVADEKRPVEPGSIVFVAAQVPHRFVDIEADLTVLVYFAADERTRGGMAAGPTPTEQTPYPESSLRGNARIFYWFGDGSAEQVAIDHGRPLWKDAYARFLTQPSPRRWRLGENFWTSLDTNIPLTLGEQRLEPGHYYLVLQHRPERGVELVALDSQAVRKQKLDAYQASETDGGIAIPLAEQPAEGLAPRLTFALEVDRSEPHSGSLHLRFGPHAYRAALTMHPE